MLRSVLVSLDLSAASNRIVERTRQLPFGERARVSLLHVVPARLPRKLRKRVERDAHAALDRAAEALARALPSVALKTVVKKGAAAAEIVKHARTTAPELIVVGRAGARGLPDLFLGSTAERVVRQAQTPALVVRLPAQRPYRRLLLALDDDEAAPEALAYAARLLRAPRAPMTLVHACETPFQKIAYPSVSAAQADEYRRDCLEKAARRMERVLRAARKAGKLEAADEIRFRLHVRHGSPRTVIAKAVTRMRAELLVLGTHARSGFAQAFLGTVAGDVLRAVTCDVLVVPPPQDAEG